MNNRRFGSKTLEQWYHEKKKVADDGKKWLASNNTLDNLKDKK